MLVHRVQAMRLACQSGTLGMRWVCLRSSHIYLRYRRGAALSERRHDDGAAAAAGARLRGEAGAADRRPAAGSQRASRSRAGEPVCLACAQTSELPQFVT